MINTLKSANTEYLLKRLYEIDDKLKDFFISAHNADVLMVEKEQIIKELKQREDRNNPLNNPASLSDRQQLNQLQAEKKQIENKIKELTTHKNGRAYGKLLGELIEQYITDEKPNIKDRYSRYNMYTKLRGGLSKEIGVKTQVYTKSEYKKALNIIETQWNYKIPKEFSV